MRKCLCVTVKLYKKSKIFLDYLTFLMKVFSIQYLWMIYVNGNTIPGDRHTFQEKGKCLLLAYCKVVLFISCRTAYVISKLHDFL